MEMAVRVSFSLIEIKVRQTVPTLTPYLLATVNAGFT